jgi:hypothetical protein
VGCTVTVHDRFAGRCSSERSLAARAADVTARRSASRSQRERGGAINLLRIVLGALVLLFGRRLYWLAVGILGVLLGFDWVSYRLTDWPPWAVWIAAGGFGVLCALGAVFLQRVSFGVGGFLAGGYLAVRLLTVLGVQNDPAPGIFFVVGGFAGAILAVVAIDWVLLALTSLVGAAAIVEGIGLGMLGSGLVFLALTAIGIVIQAADLRRGGRRPAPPSRSD